MPASFRQTRTRTSVRDQLPALYDELGGALWSYAYGLLRSAADADDVVADTFERAWRKHDTYRPRRGEPQAWIWGICRRRTLDVLRARTPDHLDALERGGPDLRMEAIGDGDEVRAALTQLTLADREVLLLRYWGDLTYAQIAAATGASENAVTVRAHRALKHLQEILS